MEPGSRFNEGYHMNWKHSNDALKLEANISEITPANSTRSVIIRSGLPEILRINLFTIRVIQTSHGWLTIFDAQKEKERQLHCLRPEAAQTEHLLTLANGQHT